MEPTQKNQLNDEFGYQRFALTEAAYDLINSLIGIYVRTCYRDPQNVSAFLWRRRVDELHTLKHKTDWSDLTSLQQLTDQLTAEYNQAAQLEIGQLPYDPARSRSIHTA